MATNACWCRLPCPPCLNGIQHLPLCIHKNCHLFEHLCLKRAFYRCILPVPRTVCNLHQRAIRFSAVFSSKALCWHPTLAQSGGLSATDATKSVTKSAMLCSKRTMSSQFDALWTLPRISFTYFCTTLVALLVPCACLGYGEPVSGSIGWI